MKQNTIAEKLLAWQVMLANMASLMEKHPYLAELRQELETQQSLVTKQSEDITRLRAQARKLTQMRKAAVAEGDDAHSRGSNMIRGIHGNANPENEQYGVAARGRRKRSKPSETPTTPAAPTGAAEGRKLES